MSIVIVVAVGVLVGAGIWLLLDPDLVRVILGVGLLGHGVALALLSSSNSGAAPLAGQDRPLADPLPQALVLTAIVIGFGVTAYLLAIAQRTAGDGTAPGDRDGGVRR